MSTSTDGTPAEISTSLHRGTNWWGAFVIGLAGTILVTGIVPFAAQSMGAAVVPAITLVVLIGMVLCLCMAELAVLMPHRTGGLPSYAYESFKPLGETTARHVGGVSGWGYWLGWFPVAPINMILAAGYIAVLLHLPLGRSLLPLGSLGTAVSVTVLIITMVGLLLLFVPCYLGIRMGATFATVLGVLAMIPLTLLVLLPVFKPSSFHWSNLSGFHYADPKTAGVTFFLAWIFVISWNAVAMEAAACYVGECRDPHRDAKIALTAEGLYGVFIYIATAVVFVGVLGASLKTADPLTLYTSFADHIFGSAGWVKYLIGVPLVFALLLSVLNAIMGVGRSLFQAAEDRMLPRWFAHKKQAPRAGPGHVLQPDLLNDRRTVRLAGPDLHLLQRGLPDRRGRRADRLLPDAPVPPRPGKRVPDAWLVPLGGARRRAVPDLRLLRGRLGRAEDRRRAVRGALPLHPRDHHRRHLPPPLPVAQDERQAARRRGR